MDDDDDDDDDFSRGCTLDSCNGGKKCRLFGVSVCSVGGGGGMRFSSIL